MIRFLICSLCTLLLAQSALVRAQEPTPSRPPIMLPTSKMLTVPSPGRISEYHAPGGLGIRVDSGAYQGYTVPPYYDSLIAKLVIYGATREECLFLSL